MLVDLKVADKFVNTGVHCNMVYVLPKNIEEVRAHLIRQGKKSADEVEARVNAVKNELEELHTKNYIEKSFQSGDLNQVFSQVVAYLKTKYTNVIFN